MTRRNAIGLWLLAMCFASLGCDDSEEQSQRDSLVKLAQLFDRPLRSPTADAVTSLHSSFGQAVRLPEDYLHFLATFGEGEFRLHEMPILAVANLTSEDESTALDLFAVLYDRDEYRVGDSMLHGFRELPGVIPWAHDFEETTFYWIAVSDHPEEWRVAYETGAGELRVFPGSTTDLMLAWLQGDAPFVIEDSGRDYSQVRFVPN